MHMNYEFFCEFYLEGFSSGRGNEGIKQQVPVLGEKMDSTRFELVTTSMSTKYATTAPTVHGGEKRYCFILPRFYGFVYGCFKTGVPIITRQVFLGYNSL